MWKQMSLFECYPASKVLLLIAFYMVFVWSPARKLKISGHGERGKGIQHSSFFGHFCYKLIRSDKKGRKNLGKKFALILLWLQSNKTPNFSGRMRIVSSEQRTGSNTLFFLCVLRAILLISKDQQSICWDERLNLIHIYALYSDHYRTVSAIQCQPRTLSRFAADCFHYAFVLFGPNPLSCPQSRFLTWWTLCGQD